MLQERAEFELIGQASDGSEGVQKAQAMQPDLILLDIALPTTNGIEAAQQIGKLAPKSKILFLSQIADPAIVEAALSAGGNGYVVKSDAGDQLFQAIKTIIRGGQFVSGKLARRISNDVSAPWKLVGKVIEACSCDTDCPCKFNEPPTTGKCEGGWTWHIEDGAYGRVRLDGLNFSVYAKWPGAVYDGNGEAVVFIDDRADNSQWLAITDLVGGRGGGPWGVLAPTWCNVHGPYGVAYDIAFDGVKTRIKSGESLEIECGPVCNPLTGVESHRSLVLPEGIIFKQGDLGASVRFRLKRGVQYDHSGKHIAVGAFNYSGLTAPNTRHLSVP
jgi:CheY-like chemotaxis protein